MAVARVSVHRGRRWVAENGVAQAGGRAGEERRISRPGLTGRCCCRAPAIGGKILFEKEAT